MAANAVLTLVLLGVLPPAASAGIRAAYGEGAMKTWLQAQDTCAAWGGSLVKADGDTLGRLSRVKCTDALWVGAQESPAEPGINPGAWKWVADGSPVANSAWKKSPLSLVPKGQKNKLVFADAARLKSGEVTALTLASHPGTGVGKKFASPKSAGDWLYIEAVPVPESKSVRVQYVDKTFLKLVDENLVLDVAYGKLEKGIPVNFVGAADESQPGISTICAECSGRHFTVNDDGTIALTDKPDLVLGGFNQEEPNNWEGAEEECGMVGIEDKFSTELYDAQCATVLPFACEMPDLTVDEMVWIDGDASLEKIPVCWADLAAEKGASLGAIDFMRTDDVIIRVKTSVPSKPGCLFEAGGAGQGTFIGLALADGGSGPLHFRFTAGDGGAAKDVSDKDTAVISIPVSDKRIPQDGREHEFIMKISVANHSVGLLIDGIPVASGGPTAWLRTSS